MLTVWQYKRQYIYLSFKKRCINLGQSLKIKEVQLKRQEEMKNILKYLINKMTIMEEQKNKSKWDKYKADSKMAGLK